MYGIYDATNDLSLEFPSNKVIVKYDDKSGIMEYRRIHKNEGRVLINKVISGGIRLHINPIYPILLPICIARHILVVLENPVTLAPNEIIEGYVKIPIDIASYVEEYDGAATLVDVFNEGKIKYTL